MNKARLQINLEYLIARSLLAVFGLLPLRVALWAGATLGGCGYYFSGRLRRTGERNLELAFPEMSPPERRCLLRGCFESLGRVLGQFSHFHRLSETKLRDLFVCEGLENLERARARGRGVILFTGHLGAWDLTGFALSVLGQPLSFLVRPIDNPKVNQLIEKTRTRFGNRTIDKRLAARPLLRMLLAGGVVGLLIDLNMSEREGIFVDFFGAKASTTFMPAKLALRTGADVIPIFAPWDVERRRFLLKIDEPLCFDPTGDEEEDVRRLTQLFTSVVEKYVRRYPDQWLWIHRRWKTRPPGEPSIYD